MSDFVNILSIFGGVALLVFGVRYLRKGLDRLFGQRLGTWMQRLASKRGWAFLAGVAVSLVAPSSTTISLLAVQTVRAGHMTARQMLASVLGANIGLTVMVLLIALRFEQAAPIIILVGVALYQFTQGPRSRGIGQVLLALGFIFLGIRIMMEAASAGSFDSESGLGSIINFDKLEQYAVLLACFAAVLALVLQSSTATIGLVIGLGAAGAINFRMAAPIVLGANVGLAVTTLILGWRLVESRRLALANLLLKVLVAAAGLTVLQLMGDSLPQPNVNTMSLAVAGLHTGFNVVVAIIGLPTIGLISSLLAHLVPTPLPGKPGAFGPRYITEGPIGGAALAMAQARREIMYTSEIVSSMLRDAWQALKSNNEQLIREVSQRDDQVDLLDTEIKRFLTGLAREEAEQFDADEQMRQLRYLSELETIGDIIDKNISELILKKIRLGASFSDDGEKELDDFYNKVRENFTIAENAFPTGDRQLAQQLLRHKERINQYEHELRDRHFARLNAGLTEAYETSAIYLDLLTHLKRINSCLSHLAYAILQDTEPKPTAAHTTTGE